MGRHTLLSHIHAAPRSLCTDDEVAVAVTSPSPSDDKMDTPADTQVRAKLAHLRMCARVRMCVCMRVCMQEVEHLAAALASAAAAAGPRGGGEIRHATPMPRHPQCAQKARS